MAIMLSPCCSQPLVSFSSLNYRICTECHHHHEWNLEVGKSSMYGDRLGGCENYVVMHLPLRAAA